MADEYITRYDAEMAIAEIYSPYGEDGSGDAISRKVAMSEIRHIHATDVRPVVHAKWLVYTGLGKLQYMCSNCCAEERSPEVCNYCYFCGARMDSIETAPENWAPDTDIEEATSNG